MLSKKGNQKREAASSDGSKPIVIQANDLTKAYPLDDNPAKRLKQLIWPSKRNRADEFLAVRDVNLEIYQGETVGIVGRNGSGKSTLLNLIAGTLEPTSGELHVTGHLAPILTLGAGFDPEFTGRENALMNAAVIGLSKSDINDRIDSIIEFSGIGDFIDRPVKLYSSGMYSRLAFAVAINSDPDILVIDEVLSVGDEAFARKCFARLEELKSAGSTILFVSHSSQMVIELCDRAILIEAGERILTANPRDTVAYYHKLLYAEESAHDSLIDEIRKFDVTGVAESTDSKGLSPPSTDVRNLGQYDPGLLPESTSEYQQLGAQIQNVRILDSRDEVVNVLNRGGEYTYAYDVVFSESAYGVRFGMMIKAATGLEIAGQVSHSADEIIEHVPGQNRARVYLPFRVNLNSGVYFVNAGVMAAQNGEAIYLHRILDALAFRVEFTENDRMTGRVDLTASSPRTEFSSLP
ncbi:MAG: ABC transporter ATP-binding protein [Myxococcota bacterium]|jgi:lipopolysaccharide transport system ATP-binding protein|nr:ABC transporter ATP-binding protein [Myxococcota bacterium]